MEKRLYVKFNFKAKKDSNKGIFVVAFYRERDDKKPFYKTVEELKLWENRQFVNACQSYWYLNEAIYRNQGILIEAGYTELVILTANSTLYKWINDISDTNEKYFHYMMKASRDFMDFGDKEIVINRRLGDLMSVDNSYYFCRPCFLSKANNDVEVTYLDTEEIDEEEEVDSDKFVKI